VLLFLLQLLGLQVKRAEISELLAEVDSDGSGEVEYPEFIEIMTSTLAKLAEKKEEEGSAGNQVGVLLCACSLQVCWMVAGDQVQ
jgi:hypothetical protein